MMCVSVARKMGREESAIERERRRRGNSSPPPLVSLFAPASFYARPTHIVDTLVTQAIKPSCHETTVSKQFVFVGKARWTWAPETTRSAWTTKGQGISRDWGRQCFMEIFMLNLWSVGKKYLCRIVTMGLEQSYNRGCFAENNTLLKELPLFSLYDASVFDVTTPHTIL